MPETLTGRVERIIFKDESEGFAVFEVEAEGHRVRVAGKALDLMPGLEVRVTGEYWSHPRFGWQLKASSVMVLPPEKPGAIAAYLASGQVRGVGKGLAQRLLAFFGERIRDALDAGPHALQECPGIGPQRAWAIYEAWHRQKQERETYVLLAGFGLTHGQIVKISRVFGVEAPARVQNNPYELVHQVPGIGFKTADSIAEKVGIPKDAGARLEAALHFVLEDACEAGHVFLAEEDLIEKAVELTAQSVEKVRAALESEVSRGRLIRILEAQKPLVYLKELFETEMEVAQRLATLSSQDVSVMKFEGKTQFGFILGPSQRQALELLGQAPICVLTGGPGTGKTTVIGALIEAALRKGLRVALAAPTGRAAMRLKEATGFEAKTIHRLLEYNARTQQFGRDELNPLDADWVVIDEASMLDVILLRHLLKAIAPGSRLTFVGDSDQLPPVGPGDPFRDIIASKTVPVARLSEVFRQGPHSTLVAVANGVLLGREPKPRAAGNGEGLQDFYVVWREDPKEVCEVIERLVLERIPARFGLDPVKDIQVLAPMHKGDCGTDALNRLLRARLNAEAASSSGLRPGDKVIQTRNNYDKEIFNGDIGRVLSCSTDGSIRVKFEDKEVDLDPSEAEDLSLAYAITVHKAQGSEFPAVLVALHTQHFIMLRRNLLYTALTRAKKLCVLVGNQRAIRIAVANDRVEQRNTRLAMMLRELASRD